MPHRAGGVDQDRVTSLRYRGKLAARALPDLGLAACLGLLW
ncbi:MAG: hypothetical protein QOH95_648, partial [Gaiellaceae bacterium]|nr:hypothetical protein [Gaiellaceae bacterium]